MHDSSFNPSDQLRNLIINLSSKMSDELDATSYSNERFLVESPRSVTI